jgi:photosynthetic reaction center cytochrome c subunit
MKSIRFVLILVAVLALFGAALSQVGGAAPAQVAAPQQPGAQASTPAAPPQEPTAEKQFKNIQTLKELPASQLVPVMMVVSASLGVGCEHCHVTAPERKFDADDKKPKQVARQMMQMVFDINKNNFGGRNEVTCNTCHRGSHDPVGIPAFGMIPSGEGAGEHDHAAENLPTTADLLDKYIAALGGASAIQGLKSRVSRGELLHAKIENAGGQQKIINRGASDPLEVAQVAPNKIAFSGSASQVYDGSKAWVNTPRGPRFLNPEQTAILAAAGNLQAALALKERAARLRVVGKDSVDGKDAYVVGGAGLDGRRARYFFDAQSGLLVRRIAYSPTPVGPFPEQLDYSDYRDVGGVKVPFTVKHTFLEDDRQGITEKYSEIKNNVPVDEAKFQPPPAPPAQAAQPANK